MKQFDLEAYVAEGVEAVVRGIVRSSLFCPAETAFLARFAAASRQATERRKAHGRDGTHVPPFLIASISSKCNLHCAGCYARSLSTCEDGEPVEQMTADEWGRIFREAEELGISFILLAGGEPLVRRDVIEQAAKVRNILFPIFTNGTMLNEDYQKLLDKNRNLVPVFSIEGGPEQTDLRRGTGIYETVSGFMADLKKKHITFAASITVTKENHREVTSEAFLQKLTEQGCRAVVYVEFVPVSAETEHLAPEDREREEFAARLARARERFADMLLISFPGDEKSSEGCLAAGRGFFHINSHGGAEPCPFSPYSDVNVRRGSLMDAMQSRLFTALRGSDMLIEDHKGGCVLFERREQVEQLVAAAPTGCG